MNRFTNAVASGRTLGREYDEAFTHKSLMFLGTNSMNKGMLGFGGLGGLSGAAGGAIVGGGIGSAYGGISNNQTWDSGLGYGAAIGAGLGVLGGAVGGARYAWKNKPLANRYTRAAYGMEDEGVDITKYNPLFMNPDNDLLIRVGFNKSPRDELERKWYKR